ncbi:hypothetical protein Microterr_09970 [Microbacterium terricola]|uniref:Uncharacterized protein n=1 Tax=Microbacterium terricola TaxID=344163 RepID=A0ABM8DXH7_9MICO|nr:hypothetical protein Microterr_09970 [Microbacterium terricola]
MSTTVSPVTHTALVDVNSAWTNDAPPGPVAAIGSISNPVPIATARPNPTTTAWAGRSPVRTRTGRLPAAQGARRSLIGTLYRGTIADTVGATARRNPR